MGHNNNNNNNDTKILKMKVLSDIHTRFRQA